MLVLPDTNVLLASFDPGHPMQLTAEAAILTLQGGGHAIRLVPQLLYEVWVVATRPVNVNGLGKSVSEAADILRDLRTRYALFPDNALILPEWERFVTTYAVLGKKAHDARLAAAMRFHGVTHILTFNDADFRRFPGLTVLTPAGVLAPGP